MGKSSEIGIYKKKDNKKTMENVRRQLQLIEI